MLCGRTEVNLVHAPRRGISHHPLVYALDLEHGSWFGNPVQLGQWSSLARVVPVSRWGQRVYVESVSNRSSRVDFSASQDVERISSL
eukprot:634606-Prymnesium_polylepis.2